MTNDPNAVLTRTYQALSAMSEIDTVPLSICSITLDILPEVPELSEVRVKLLTRLTEAVTADFIAQRPLLEVFMTLSSVQKERKVHTAGKETALVAKRLLASEKTVGGPYVSEDGVLDPLANAYIALFIRQVAEPLPNVEAYITEHMSKPELLRHPMYTQSACAYLLAQARTEESTAVDLSGIFPKRRSPGQIALRLLISRSVPSSSAVKKLLKAQLPDGLWAGEPFLRGVRSRLLTTALIIGALVKTERDTQSKNTISAIEESIHRDIACEGHQLYERSSEPLRSMGNSIIEKVLCADKKHEITLLPFYFARSLGLPLNIHTIEKCRLLGLANMLCWAAYTIYDDLLDDEGKLKLLPAANIAHRASLTAYRRALGEMSDFLFYVEDGFAGMDEANTWELKHCRFTVKENKIHVLDLPDYGELDVLANRAFGHVLGPLAVVFVLHDSATDRQKGVIESGLRHYLIARQLNDDLHDWQRDIQKGQITYVVAAILRDLAIPPGVYNLDQLLAAMKLCFWSRTLPTIVSCMLSHASQSRRLAKESGIILHEEFIWPFIDKLEGSARVALASQVSSQEFMNTYQDSTPAMVRS